MELFEVLALLLIPLVAGAVGTFVASTLINFTAEREVFM